MQPAAAAGAALGIEDFRITCDAAYASVDMPDSVIDVLTSVRLRLHARMHARMGGRGSACHAMPGHAGPCFTTL